MFNREFIEKFYGEHIDLSKGRLAGEELRAPCPYHDDDTPSFSLNLNTGLYKCFVANCKLFSGGNIYKFLSNVADVTLLQAKTEIDEKYSAMFPPKVVKKSEKVPCTEEDILEKMAVLNSNQDALKVLYDFGWTAATINKFQIGYERFGNKYWIPIRDFDKLVNIRKYCPNRIPKFTNIQGCGYAMLWPTENLEGQELYLMEGEKDCILAIQWGFNAITASTGAGTFRSEWKEYFIDKDVIICYDIDKAGIDGAANVAKNIIPGARSVKVVKLPMKVPKNADFSDYAKSGKTPQDFHALVKKTKVEKKQQEGPVQIHDAVKDVALDKIDEMKMFYKRAKMNVRVIGKDFSPFIIPECIEVTCNKDNGKSCYNCSVGDTGGKSIRKINETTNEVLELVECSNRDKRSIIKEIFGIPNCRKFKMMETDHQSIIKTQVIPSVDDIQFDSETYNQKYVERELYYLGKSLEANMDYEIEAIAMPSSRDQTLVHLGYKVKHADSSIEEFTLTDAIKESLKIFHAYKKEVE